LSGARNLHKSLKSEILGTSTASGAELALVKLAWGKEDVAFTLHVVPNTFSTYGIQIPDLLSYSGFSRQPCSFLTRECYVKEVNADVNLNAFGKALGEAYQQLSQAQRHLERCGFILDQPEGWGYFFGQQSGGRSRSDYYGDGHISAIPPQVMKTAEDDVFHFVFTWIKNSESEKGWTIHYRPKHSPLSVELQGVFHFLGIDEFRECPQFEFESCSWRHIEFREGGDHIFENGNASVAHGWFDSHQLNFSPGIKALLTAQATMEEVGMGFLPSFAQPEMRRTQEITRHITSPSTMAPKPASSPMFDVAISFAGTERKLAQELATRVKTAGFQVFYDEFFPEELWGKNLGEFFHEIYSKRSRFCVIFVSAEYLEREWTVHERRSAQERMLKDKGNEYILPIKVDDVELPGIPSTIGYLPISTGIDKIADALISKLKNKR